MKKALVIILGFSMLPFSSSHCKHEPSEREKMVIGLVTIGWLYLGYRWYYSEVPAQPVPTNPQQLQKPQDPQQTEPAKATENKQPQEQPKPTPPTNSQQSLDQIEHQKAVAFANALIQQYKEAEQKKAALLKEKLQQPQAPQPEVKITPVSETSKPSDHPSTQQPNYGLAQTLLNNLSAANVGKIFKNNLDILEG